MNSKKEDKESKKRKLSDKYLVKRLAKYLLISKRTLLIILIIMIINISSIIINPYLISIALDDLIVNSMKEQLIFLGSIYFFTFVVNTTCTFFERWQLSVMGETAIYHLREDTFNKIQELDLEYHDKTPTGDIISRMTNDLDSLKTILSGEVLGAVISLIMVVVMFIIMLSISPILTLCSFLIIPITAGVAYFTRNTVRPLWKTVRDKNAKVTANMNENITGARVSQSYARSEHNLQEFEKINDDLASTFIVASRKGALVNGFFEISGPLSYIIVLVVGSFIYLYNPDLVTLGIIFLFMIYIQQFFGPVFQITGVYNQIQTSFAAFERIVTVLDTNIKVVEKIEAQPLSVEKGSIEFTNVSFAYTGKINGNGSKISSENIPVLENFNLTIKPNECLAIVGSTGSGKTTLINLISRLYDIQEGSISIDNQDIRDVTFKSLRKNIAVVLQEPFLYSDSIHYNLNYTSNGPVSDDKMMEALDLVGANFIRDLPDGLDTIVGERGGRLSLGQKQLVSFARALITDPKILLLDEATSSIDPQAELRIQKAMKKMLQNRTSIIVAHRLSTVKAADKIIVLDHGKIIEQGTFDELLDQQGQFYELYNLQFRNNN